MWNNSSMRRDFVADVLHYNFILYESLSAGVVLRGFEGELGGCDCDNL